MPTLVDVAGKPLPPNSRLRGEDPDVLIGLRRKRFAGVIAAGLTPTILVSIFDEMKRGRLDNFLTLAKELEQHDSHYRSVLGTRKLSVLRRRPVVEPASEDSRDVFIAEEFERVVHDPSWFWLTLGMLDALGKGYSCTEIVWDFSEGQANPSFKDRDPRDFTLDVDTLTKVVRKIPGSVEVEEPPPGKYVVHSPSLIRGSPVDGALARTEAILYLYGTLALQDLGDYLERFGTPTLLGEYANETQRQEVLDGLAALVRAGYGAIPKGVRVDTLDGAGARSGSNANLHESVMRFLDQQKSKLVLSQTMSTEDGSSRSQAEVHDTVRTEVVDFDCWTVSETQQQQIARIWTTLNYGEGVRAPFVGRPGDKREDVKTIVDALFGVADRSGDVAVRTILELLGVTPPEAGDQLLQPKGSGGGGGGGAAPDEAVEEQPSA